VLLLGMVISPASKRRERVDAPGVCYNANHYYVTSGKLLRAIIFPVLSQIVSTVVLLN
jgi:hypothetical protein